MTEYWKSRDRWYCIYCKIYIADDKPSRTHHEGGLRHKGAVDKYVRDLYKKGEQDKRDKVDEAREIASINAAAMAANAKDGRAGSVTSTAPAPVRKSTATRSNLSSNPYANYSDAASLGFVDPDAEKIIALAQQRKQEGRVGDWSIVNSPVASTSRTPIEETPPDPDDFRQTTSRSFREKTKGLGNDDLYDPSTTIKLKRKNRPKSEDVEAPKEETADAAPVEVSPPEANIAQSKMKGFKVAIKPQEASAIGAARIVQPPPEVKEEEDAVPVAVSAEAPTEQTTVKQEEEEAPSMFKKRKGQNKSISSNARRKLDV